MRKRSTGDSNGSNGEKDSGRIPWQRPLRSPGGNPSWQPWQLAGSPPTVCEANRQR